MKKIIAAVFTVLIVVVMTLASVFTLVGASLAVAQMTSPLLRTVAVAAELVLGVLLLVGTVYLATHIAVRIFAGEPPPGYTGSSSATPATSTPDHAGRSEKLKNQGKASNP